MPQLPDPQNGSSQSSARGADSAVPAPDLNVSDGMRRRSPVPISGKQEHILRDLLSAAIRRDDLDEFQSIGTQAQRVLTLDVGNGLTPVAEAFSEGAIKITAWLFQKGFKWPSYTDPECDPFCAVVAREGLLSAVSRCMAISARVPEELRALNVFPFIDRLTPEQQKLLSRYDTARKGVEDRIRIDNRGGSPDRLQQLLDYADGLMASQTPLQRLEEIVWAFEVVSQVKWYQPSKDLYQLAYLVHRSFQTGDPELALIVAGCIDQLVYYPTKPRSNDTSQPDLMLLLNHPKVSTDLELVSVVSEAFTAAPAFTNQGVPSLPYGLVDSIFGRIGYYAHSTIRLKFDTRSLGGLSPLISEFGFERVEDPDKISSKKLGPCFIGSPYQIESTWKLQPWHYAVLNRIHFDTQFIFRRGALCIRNVPEQRELWIQSASPVFGRNCLGAAALLANQGVRAEGLVPSRRAGTIFNADFYRSESSLEIRQINACLAELDALFTLYRMWKFDTARDTAFQDIGARKAVAVGFHNSPGFNPLLVRLEAHWDSSLNSKTPANSELSGLAFIDRNRGHPNLLIESKFGHARVRTLSVDAELIAVLQGLESGELRGKQLRMTRSGNHLYEAGMLAEGDLVIV